MPIVLQLQQASIARSHLLTRSQQIHLYHLQTLPDFASDIHSLLAVADETCGWNERGFHWYQPYDGRTRTLKVRRALFLMYPPMDRADGISPLACADAPPTCRKYFKLLPLSTDEGCQKKSDMPSAVTTALASRVHGHIGLQSNSAEVTRQLLSIYEVSLKGLDLSSPLQANLGPALEKCCF